MEQKQSRKTKHIPIASVVSPASERRRHFLKVITIIFAFYLCVNIGGKANLVTRSYEIEDARIHSDVRIAVICDLHGAQYGKGQSQILGALETAQPDVVLLLGDIFDQYGGNENSYALVDLLSDQYKCYFILGNHEYKSGEMTRIRAALKAADIPILSGESASITKGDTTIEIFGIDDVLGGKLKQQQEILNAAAARADDVFSILAIHAPNEVESLLQYGFDLMLSGHTHGGQIILPGVFNGLYAPGQGFFPKYGGGRYDFTDQTLIICRGLARKPLWLPRVCNPPEIAVITLKPIATNP